MVLGLKTNTQNNRTEQKSTNQYAFTGKQLSIQLLKIHSKQDDLFSSRVQSQPG